MLATKKVWYDMKCEHSFKQLDIELLIIFSKEELVEDTCFWESEKFLLVSQRVCFTLFEAFLVVLVDICVFDELFGEFLDQWISSNEL